jgi:hypothetical protein
MPNKQALRPRLSEQVQRGLPQRAFAEEELYAFLSTATFDGGHLHRYVEGRSAEGEGSVADLQASIDQFPVTLFACLHDTARMERREKRALQAYLRATVASSTSATMLQDLLQTIEAIPETPTFEDVPRFLLPGW